MIPYMVGKLTPNLSHLTRGLVKYVPGRGYFRAVPFLNGDKYVTSPPPPQSLNLSYLLPRKVVSSILVTSSFFLPPCVAESVRVSKIQPLWLVDEMDESAC